MALDHDEDGVVIDRLYNFTTGYFCGVLLKESAMKRLAKLEAKFRLEAKRILLEEADNGNVFSSNWGLVYPEGKQTVYHYISKNHDVRSSDDVRSRIDISLFSKIEYKPLVFAANDYSNAKVVAEKYFETHSEKGE